MTDAQEPVEHRSAPTVEPGTRAYPVETTGYDAAFSDFYRSEVRRLVNFLLWMGARLPDASDLAQETMLDAYRNWPSIRRPSAWARTVSSRKFARRLASTEPVTELPEGSFLLSGRHDATEWEERHEVLRLLRTLPWRQRQVMAWSFDGYQPHEIAVELDITPDAVRASLMLARRTLADELNQSGGDRQ